MDTILNYISEIFSGVPENDETIRLREDMTANMTDKYDELISEGKSENEAVGTVISEFGSIDEVLAEMGIKRAAANAGKTSSPVGIFFRNYALRLLLPVPALAVIVYELMNVVEKAYLEMSVNWTLKTALAAAAAALLLALAYLCGKRADAKKPVLTDEHRAALTKLSDRLNKVSDIACIVTAIAVILGLYCVFISLVTYMGIWGTLIEFIPEAVPFIAAICCILYIHLRDIRRTIDRQLGRTPERLSVLREAVWLSLPVLICAVCRFWHILENADNVGQDLERYMRDFVPVTVTVCLVIYCTAYLVDTFMKHRKK